MDFVKKILHITGVHTYVCTMYTEWTSMDTFLKSAENDGFLYVALTMANWPN